MPHYQRNIRFILFIILPILGFLLGWSLSQKNHQAPITSTSKTETTETVTETKKINFFKKTKPRDVDLDIFWETWETMEANFLHNEKLKTNDQVYGATKGLVKSLGDPYTVFMTPDENKKFEESMNGAFEGIGAEIAIKENQLTIVAPLKGSPAEKADLRAGDVVYKIDGEVSHDLTIEEAILKIRGPKGEKVTLTVIREGLNKPLDIVIIRDNIVINSVEWEMKDEIAYIEITQFGNGVVKEFQEAVSEILLKSPEGIVIDLRNNGGGLLEACIKILSEFEKEKVVVKTKGRKFGDTGDHITGRDGAFLETPLIVLVNEGSASASEIFAGAVQDYRRGVVLGKTTFGKGSVQNLISFPDGSSLKVTVAEWLTPSGRSIHKTGIEPDETIVPTDEDFENDFDPVLERALDIIGTDQMTEILNRPVVTQTTDDEDQNDKTLEKDGEISDAENIDNEE